MNSEPLNQPPIVEPSVPAANAELSDEPVGQDLPDEPVLSQSDIRRRRWAVIVAFALLLTVTAVGLVLLATRGMPDDARAELGRYLAYRYPTVGLPTIRQANLATRTAVLTREESGASYSNTVHYRTTAFLSQNTHWRTDRTLPFPPIEVWCVRLDSADPGAGVVLVALHQDLYNAGWVVHELPVDWSAAERSALLKDLGCGITLTD